MTKRTTTPGPLRRRLALVATAVGTALLLASCGSDTELPQNTLDPEGPWARKIDDLWWLVFWIAVVIFVLVAVALAYSIWKFRERPGDEDRKIRQLHGNTRLEILWTIIPAVLLAVLAVPTVATVFALAEEPPDALQVSVVGHQWWWEYEYPEFGIVTANELHIPVETEVYLTMTSTDVIHSYWVPKLNGKMDAVPNRTSFLNLYADNVTPPDDPLLGQCAEFCGLSHANMLIKVYVHDEQGFADWVAAQQRAAPVPTEGPAAAGWETFNLVCTACHAATVDNAGTIETVGQQLAPNLTHFGSRQYFAGAWFLNTPDNVHDWLRDPTVMKPMAPQLNDLAAGRILGMPNFGLDEEEIAGLQALLELWQ